MQIMAVFVVVCQNRHLGKARVIQSFSQKSAVMGKTAVADIFPHSDSRMVRIIFSALQSGQGLSDDDLGRETDVIMYIFLSKTDSILTPRL